MAGNLFTGGGNEMSVGFVTFALGFQFYVLGIVLIDRGRPTIIAHPRAA